MLILNIGTCNLQERKGCKISTTFQEKANQLLSAIMRFINRYLDNYKITYVIHFDARRFATVALILHKQSAARKFDELGWSWSFPCFGCVAHISAHIFKSCSMKTRMETPSFYWIFETCLWCNKQPYKIWESK